MGPSETESSPRVHSTKASSLRQHPVSPIFAPSTPDATQAIFLNHPSARISSSPASSPRIIDPAPQRRGSVRPAMSKPMQSGVAPGFDFFDDGSSGSEWEDSEGDVTQTFSEVHGLGLRSLVSGNDNRSQSLPRGRSRDMTGLTALPQFHAFAADDSGLGIEDERVLRPTDSKDARRARPMSLTRLDKHNVRVVNNRSNAGTPRSSLRSSGSDAASPIVELMKPFTFARTNEPTQTPGIGLHGRHRSNTSGSLIADSIIDAHVTTMRALEALNLSPPRGIPDARSRSFLHSASITDVPKLPSFTANRHITIPPLSTVDHNRPAHLPSHFIKTPYPFTAKKEFPKPDSRPRQRGGVDETNEKVEGDLTRLDSGYGKGHKKEYDDRKGKQVLGLVISDGEYDLRSRLERNEDAQGVIRNCAGEDREGSEGSESIVWLGIQRKPRWLGGATSDTRRITKIVVPSNLTTSHPDPVDKRNKGAGDVEFDDNFFAERLISAYRELAGSWLRRTLSARKLERIQLGQTCAWSGMSLNDQECGTSGLLSIAGGIPLHSESASPFTEERLMKLYKKPFTGKARYTWVHWARRVATSNDPATSTRRPSTRARRRARSPNRPSETGHKSAFSPYSDESASNPPYYVITTIDFVCVVSTRRILTVIAFMLLASVAAAVLWVFLGTAGSGLRFERSRQRSDRVGPGMAIGILVLLMEVLGFGAWVCLS